MVVTGGSGKLGRAVVRDLLDHGWEVVVLDSQGGADDRAQTLRIDLTEYGQVLGALTAVDDSYAGVDAVVHLAAIPAPGLAPNAATFANNVLATYHVFEAARVAQVRNVVWASSETVLGLPFTQQVPPYLPVDEDYRAVPMTSYSLGKAVDEELAHHFCRWDPATKIVGLRFSNVMEPHDYAGFDAFQDDPMHRAWNAWGYIDARDGAQAVRKALELDATGFDVFIVANADTVMRRESADLLAEVFPDVALRRPVAGRETLLSIDKARRVLGYAPQHSWLDQPSG
ncbi:MAG TPA: NAD(P)-dependent oxidoreductase [Candidatus Nanopelagicales bacterium]|nr:NAD(P)-dependent oxidoreductase [Candidatus Nanopelagicales bacterium]